MKVSLRFVCRISYAFIYFCIFRFRYEFKPFWTDSERNELKGVVCIECLAVLTD